MRKGISNIEYEEVPGTWKKTFDVDKDVTKVVDRIQEEG